MELTSEEFAQLTSPAGEIATGTDKRRWTRVERRSAMVITLAAGDGGAAAPLKLGQSLSVTLRDFSPQGVSILLDRALPKASGFVAKVMRPDQTPAAVLYEVVYCTQLNAHLFKVGARVAASVAQRA